MIGKKGAVALLERKKNQASDVALGGVFAALAIVVMCMGGSDPQPSAGPGQGSSGGICISGLLPHYQTKDGHAAAEVAVEVDLF